MCGSGNYVAGAISAAQDTLNTLSEMKAANANRKIIDQASVQRQGEINSAGSLQLNETMMAERAARAHSIAAASGSGVNLGSNSFLASLQTTAMSTANKSQVELENTNNAQIDNQIKTQSELNSKASSKTFFGWWVGNNMAYLSGAYGGSMTGAKDGQMTTVDANGNVPSAAPGNYDGSLTGTAGDGEFTGSGTGTSDQSMASTAAAMASSFN